MPNAPLQNVIHHLRRVVSREKTGDLTDAQLLDDFVQRRDEAAFELLVWRHAALVLGVCRRLLHDRHEAEDAFQATFLVLIRKAASISNRDSVGSWLHKVAVRIAHRARAQAAKRCCRALPGEDIPAREPTDEVLWRDLRPLLDEEVNRLPEKYRRPFVLCYLEGNTNEQAAEQLGCPRGTVLSRLARGRERLRVRLARRGVVLSGTLLATLLIHTTSEAAVPAALVSVIVKAAIPFAAGNVAAGLVSARAAAWTQGVLKAMLLTKLKISTALVLVAALAVTGAGLLSQPSLADSRPTQVAQVGRRPEPGPGRSDARGTPQTEVRGIIKAVDVDKASITLTLHSDRRDESAEEKTFTLAKTAEVGIGTGLGRRGGAYREAKLADIAPGALAVLHLGTDQKTVEAVLAEGPTVRGLIKAVDGGKNTVTIDSHAGRGGEGGEEKTYAVSKTAEVAVDDGRGKSFSIKETKVADLPAGATVTAKLSVDLKELVNLLAEGPTVGGIVKSVDAGKNQVTLTSPPSRREEAAQEQTYTVAAGGELLFDDGKPRRFALKEGKLADLPAGAIAMLRLSPDQKEVMSLRAEGPSLSGMLKVADPKKNTITIILRAKRGDTPEEDKTFTVAADARISVDGKESKLADLKADDNGPPVGLKLSLDQKVVQSITIGGSGGRR
ncbi:MAG TPA: RNA polymerase sigma factor [Gemmataceae bacterium]|nr:RNA polymerase sigma factor [Gemmataceae bacterium]